MKPVSSSEIKDELSEDILTEVDVPKIHVRGIDEVRIIPSLEISKRTHQSMIGHDNAANEIVNKKIKQEPSRIF